MSMSLWTKERQVGRKKEKGVEKKGAIMRGPRLTILKFSQKYQPDPEFPLVEKERLTIVPPLDDRRRNARESRAGLSGYTKPRGGRRDRSV